MNSRPTNATYIETLSQKSQTNKFIKLTHAPNETLCFFLYLQPEFSARINIALSAELMKLEAIFSSSIIFSTLHFPMCQQFLLILALIHFLSVFLSTSSSLLYFHYCHSHKPLSVLQTATDTVIVKYQQGHMLCPCLKPQWLPLFYAFIPLRHWSKPPDLVCSL